MPQGLLISLDGLDGAGKSTQCRLLAEWLRSQGRAVTVCRDPGSTPVGDRIREVLLDCKMEIDPWSEALLYMASRVQLVEKVIRPALERGESVIVDRFLLANVVYQGHAGGLPVEQLWDIGARVIDGLDPDLIIVLDLPPGTALSRKTGPGDRMENRGLTFFTKVRDGFLAEARRAPNKIKVIDASQPIDVVQQRICEEVSRVLGACARA